MNSSRNRVELMHQITVLHNWATDPRDTISAMSEAQAGKVLRHLKAMWLLVERRQR